MSSENLLCDTAVPLPAWIAPGATTYLRVAASNIKDVTESHYDLGRGDTQPLAARPFGQCSSRCMVRPSNGGLDMPCYIL